MKESEFTEILSRLEDLRDLHRPILVAIDGRAAAGKTTLAKNLRRMDGFPVIHTDDFYLRPEERTKSRLSIPGGNIAYERLLKDVFLPLQQGRTVAFQPYDCHTGSLGPQITIGAAPVIIVEGSYSLHPELRDAYEFKMFLTIDEDEQLRRLEQRGSDVDKFRTVWVPLEENYITACRPDACADLVFDTSQSEDCF